MMGTSALALNVNHAGIVLIKISPGAYESLKVAAKKLLVSQSSTTEH